MMLIALKEYATKVGRCESAVRRKILRGTLPAQKIGRDWLIEEDTPYEDGRITSGEYVGRRRKPKTGP